MSTTAGIVFAIKNIPHFCMLTLQYAGSILQNNTVPIPIQLQAVCVSLFSVVYIYVF